MSLKDLGIYILVALIGAIGGGVAGSGFIGFSNGWALTGAIVGAALVLAWNNEGGYNSSSNSYRNDTHYSGPCSDYDCDD